MVYLSLFTASKHLHIALVMYNVQNYSVNHTRSLKNERTTDLLVGVQSSGHDPAEDVEGGGVVGGVLLGHVDHQPSVL